METEFTPYSAILGGVLIGSSAVLFMLLFGRIAGISGIISSVLPSIERAKVKDNSAFLAGMVIASIPLSFFVDAEHLYSSVNSTVALLVGGLLVGFGVTIGSGCTSGHGVCGLSRFSLRSFIAVVVFMLTALLVFNLK